MTEFVNLMGSEDVEKAGHNIREAATRMERAAGQIDESIHRLLVGLDERLVGLDQRITQLNEFEKEVHLHLEGSDWKITKADTLMSIESTKTKRLRPDQRVVNVSSRNPDVARSVTWHGGDCAVMELDECDCGLEEKT